MDSLSRSVMVVLLVLLLSLAASVTAATGTIQINVHPGGGTVCLDTTCRDNQGVPGGTSTTVFENVEAGRYHMLNVYGTDGYEPYLGQVFLDAKGTPLSRDIYLDPLPAQSTGTGTLRVFITPDGGKVCLDRMCELSSGDRTGSWSVEYTEAAANSNHTLTITNDGYETYTAQVHLMPGETTTMTIALHPLPAGSTQPVTPAPTQSPVAGLPGPTRAALPGTVAVLAVGLLGIAYMRKKE